MYNCNALVSYMQWVHGPQTLCPCLYTKNFDNWSVVQSDFNQKNRYQQKIT